MTHLTYNYRNTFYLILIQYICMHDTLKINHWYCQVNSGCSNTLDSIPHDQFTRYLYEFNIKLK